MSVIVKNMEMPKNCFACACASYYERLDRAMCDLTNKQLDQKVWKKERHPDCPLIELPPHGDLADLSDIVHPNDSMRRMTIDEQLRRTCEGWSADRKQYVVIEAEGET